MVATSESYNVTGLVDLCGPGFGLYRLADIDNKLVAVRGFEGVVFTGS